MKKSKLQRKFVNQMRGMGEIPWPQRRFRYPPTFGTPTAAQHIGHCKRPVGEVQVRRGRLRRKTTEQIKCGGRVFLRRGSLGKRRVYCEDCRTRKKQRQLARRFEARITRLTPREQHAEERRRSRILSRLRRPR